MVKVMTQGVKYYRMSRDKEPVGISLQGRSKLYRPLHEFRGNRNQSSRFTAPSSRSLENASHDVVAVRVAFGDQIANGVVIVLLLVDSRCLRTSLPN